MRLGHPRRRIDRYLSSGDLSIPAEEELRAHLRGCEECRAYFDEGALLLRATRGGGPGLGELERLERRAVALARPSSARQAKPLLWPRLALAGAAVVALAIGAAALLGGSEVGEVRVAGEALHADGRPVAAGEKLRAGQQLEAVRGESVLELARGRKVLLREGARARVERGGARVALERGRAWFSVRRGEGEFVVAAGDAEVSVLGTTFAVERRRDETVVSVTEGKVKVKGARSEVLVPAGEETTVSGGLARPPRPTRLLDDRELFERVLRRGEELLKGIGKDLDRAFGK